MVEAFVHGMARRFRSTEYLASLANDVAERYVATAHEAGKWAFQTDGAEQEKLWNLHEKLLQEAEAVRLLRERKEINEAMNRLDDYRKLAHRLWSSWLRKNE